MFTKAENTTKKSCVAEKDMYMDINITTKNTRQQIKNKNLK